MRRNTHMKKNLPDLLCINNNIVLFVLLNYSFRFVLSFHPIVLNALQRMWAHLLIIRRWCEMGRNRDGAVFAFYLLFEEKENMNYAYQLKYWAFTHSLDVNVTIFFILIFNFYPSLSQSLVCVIYVMRQILCFPNFDVRLCSFFSPEISSYILSTLFLFSYLWMCLVSATSTANLKQHQTKRKIIIIFAYLAWVTGTKMLSRSH